MCSRREKYRRMASSSRCGENEKECTAEPPPRQRKCRQEGAVKFPPRNPERGKFQ